jgi:hypothetical protein
MEPVTYTWCHGSAGTSQLFAAFAHAGVDHVAGYEVARRRRLCLNAILASGVPRRPRPGFWDNDGRCCGTAGSARRGGRAHRRRTRLAAHRDPGRLVRRRRQTRTRRPTCLGARTRPDRSQLPELAGSRSAPPARVWSGPPAQVEARYLDLARRGSPHPEGYRPRSAPPAPPPGCRPGTAAGGLRPSASPPSRPDWLCSSNTLSYACGTFGDRAARHAEEDLPCAASRDPATSAATRVAVHRRQHPPLTGTDGPLTPSPLAPGARWHRRPAGTGRPPARADMIGS